MAGTMIVLLVGGELLSGSILLSALLVAARRTSQDWDAHQTIEHSGAPSVLADETHTITTFSEDENP